MKRRVFKTLWTLSLLLCIVVCTFWWRSGTTFESFYVVMPSGALWAVGSRDALVVMRVSGWRAPPRYWHEGYDIHSELDQFRDHTILLLIFSGFGGASTRQYTLFHVAFSHGQLCSLADASGNPRLCPPFPHGNSLTWNLTRPMPFWSVVAPHGLFAILLAAPTLLILGAKSRRDFVHLRQYSSLIRYHNATCVYCGYDLRFSPDRCPECGSPKPAASDFRRLEKTRSVLCSTWKLFRRLVLFVVTPNTLLAATLISAAFAIGWGVVTIMDAWRLWPHTKHSEWQLMRAMDLAGVARWTAATCFLLWCQRRLVRSRNTSAIATASSTPGSISARTMRDEGKPR